MIVTVTLNPSLDRTLTINALERGEVIRAIDTREDPAGKGVNVARSLAAAGDEVLAVLPVGGPMGRALVGMLDDTDLDYDAVPIAGATRANVTVVEPDGTTTKLNEPGPNLSAAERAAVVAAVGRHAIAGGWVVVAGSLAADQDTSVIADLAAVARGVGARFALDASGIALKDGLGAKPDLIKPNDEELGELLGRTLAGREEVLAGCQEARELGAGAVICSLGADGAVLVDDQGVWHAKGPRVEVRSTVGAGDNLLAGFLHGGGTGPEALRVGVAWATAAVGTPGTGVPLAELIDPAAVEVSQVS
ncbi:MAG: 1-phosphofructokinase [Candidatus Nanopelagicales bacterium]